MSEPPSGVLGGYGGQGIHQRLMQRLARAGTCGTDERLELRPHLLNRVQIWRVGWLIQHLGSARFDRGNRRRALMHAEVVPHDDVAWLERRRQDLAHVQIEDLSIDSTVYGKR